MLSIDYLSIFKGLPPQLATMLIAMSPIAELRAAIPVALGVYKFSIPAAVFWSVLGNVISLIFLLVLLEPLSNFLIRHFKLAKKFFDWLFKRTRRKFEKKYVRYGELALIIFVAIPLPITGSWTGTVAAFLYGIPPKRAFVLITCGITIAAIIVILTSLGAFSTLKFLI